MLCWVFLNYCTSDELCLEKAFFMLRRSTVQNPHPYPFWGIAHKDQSITRKKDSTSGRKNRVYYFWSKNSLNFLFWGWQAQKGVKIWNWWEQEWESPFVEKSFDAFASALFTPKRDLYGPYLCMFTSMSGLHAHEPVWCYMPESGGEWVGKERVAKNSSA